MSTFHATTPGNASNPATWTEGSVPGATDHWYIQAQTDIDSGLPAGGSGNPELDSGAQLEIFGTCILDADATLQVNAGASVVLDRSLCQLQILGTLLLDGGTFDNSAIGELIGDSGSGVLAAYNNALLINPTAFYAGQWFPQILGDGSGNPDSVRLQYTVWNPPASATYFAPAEITSTVVAGATIDFITRDGSGAVSDPDFLPSVPVLQGGAVTNTVITLHRNATGSFTAAFDTPTGGASYYVPVSWTIAGTCYVQEFRVTVPSTDLPGKVLGGGDAVLTGPGVITANPATTVSIETETTTVRS